MKNTIITIIISALISGAVTFSIVGIQKNTEITESEATTEDRIKDFYLTETAVHASPHHIRKEISKGGDTFILVDLRSQEEYEKEHIIGAINIPAYKDANTSAYGETERIVKSFSELDSNKDIIVYCYSMPCMTGRKIGKMLTGHNIYVKHLGIGWNEWRYYWNLWNHDGEKPSVVKDYITTGSNPGEFKNIDEPETCTLGEFGC